jgi:hypothetical protein
LTPNLISIGSITEKKCLNGGVRKTLLLQNDMKYQAYAYLFEIVIEINMKWFYPPARHEARM